MDQTTRRTRTPLEASARPEIPTFVRSGVGVLPEFIWAFRAEAPRRVSALTEAILAGVTNAVVWHARRLKNNALNVGAVQLAQVCDVIEQQAQVGSLPLTKPLTVLLASDNEGAREALAELGN